MNFLLNFQEIFKFFFLFLIDFLRFLRHFVPKVRLTGLEPARHKH